MKEFNSLFFKILRLNPVNQWIKIGTERRKEVLPENLGHVCTLKVRDRDNTKGKGRLKIKGILFSRGKPWS
jgi:hypothetical protein